MKVINSSVRKMTILDVENIDPIAVIVEDQGPGVGKITITCFGSCWTYYWGSMGKQHTLASFFVSCDAPYLAGKLSSGIRDEIDDDDEEQMTRVLRAEIVKNRRENRLDGREARDLWDRADDPKDHGGHLDGELFYEVFGDDWWDRGPKKPNPDYIYLCRVIEVVKAAFALESK